MEELIVMLVGKYPMLVAVFSIVGVLRAVFKPLMSLIEAYVGATESKKDDAVVEGFKAGKIYKAIVWFIDYFSSIKIDKVKAPEAAKA
jgi:hypothetical protein